jgi:hypothetical protein
MGADETAARISSGEAESRTGDGEQPTREGLAERLDGIVGSLDEDFEDLSQEWPPDDETQVVGFWAAHLEKVKGQIDEIQDAANECRKVTGTDPGQSPPEPLKDLTVGLLAARQTVQAALRGFQASDDAVQYEAQSALHMKALQQLVSLSLLCKALAKHLRGMKGGLPGQTPNAT